MPKNNLSKIWNASYLKAFIKSFLCQCVSPNTIESPFYRESLWVRILMPEDEDREIEMGELAAEISTDILLDYGYHITISTAEGLAAAV